MGGCPRTRSQNCSRTRSQDCPCTNSQGWFQSSYWNSSKEDCRTYRNNHTTCYSIKSNSQNSFRIINGKFINGEKKYTKKERTQKKKKKKEPPKKKKKKKKKKKS